MKGPRIVKKKAIDVEKDPYLTGISPADSAVCRLCGAVYHDKRWSLGGKKTAAAAKPVVCPACRKIRDNFAEGFVTISGGFLAGHKDEIIHLVRNREKVAMRYNPLGRIIELKERRGAIEITTTTEKLAQRIGQMLKKTFGGLLEYKWSEDVKLARVLWSRETAKEATG